MQLDQKKKIFLIAGIAVFLIGAFVVGFVILSSGGGGESSSNTTNSSTTTTPAPTVPGVTPPAGVTPPGMPAPGAPLPPMAGGPPGAMPMPPGTPGTPSIPGMPPGMPGAAAATGAAPGMPGMMGGMAPEQTARPKTTNIVDPFKGGPSRIISRQEIENRKRKNPEPYIPIYRLPAVPTRTDGVTTPVEPDAFEEDNTNDDDDFFFGAKTNAAPNVSRVKLGRTVGWIADEDHGKVTAYFEREDGSYVGLNIGSVVNGMRVKSITKDSMVLRDESTGYEETLKLQACSRKQAATKSVSNTSPVAMPTWGTH